MIRLSARPTSNFSVPNGGYFGDPRDGGTRKHNGLDLSPVTPKTKGDPVVAVSPGKVVLSSYNGKDLGHYVVIEHQNPPYAKGFCTLYAHLDTRLVVSGDTVGISETVGLMGTTGASTGVHLHFGLMDKSWDGSMGSWINPMEYLQNAPGPNITDSGSIGGGGTDYPSYNLDIDPEYTRLIPDLNNQTSRGEQYLRRYRVLFIDESNKATDVSELHVIFSVVRTMLGEIQYSTIQVYNLNTETENKIISSASTVTIEAGYLNTQFGVIFSGDVIHVIRGKENATDTYIIAVAVDTGRALSREIINTTFVRGQTKRDMINTIQGQKGGVRSLEVGQIPEVYSQSKLPRGKVVYGKAKSFLDQLARSENSSLYVENGVVNILSAKSIGEGEILRLDYTSGLIDVPRQIDMGISFRCLINPVIKPNIRVNIDNKNIVERQMEIGELQWLLDADGVYYVYKVIYTGDNRGQEWYCDCEAFTSVGMIPGMIVDPAAYPWY